MPRPTRQAVAVRIATSLAAALLTLFVIHPAGGIDTDPPQCYSTFDYSVPCGSGLGFGVAAVVAIVVWFGFGALLRRGTWPGR